MNLKSTFIPPALFITLIITGYTNAAGYDSCGFRTTSLPDSIWQHSTWISAATASTVTGPVKEGNLRSADGSSWFMTTLKNNKRLNKAVWMTTGLGIYKLYVNGNTIGTEILKPGFTHADKTKRSFTYDITEAMSTAIDATNVLSVQSTPGWWADKIITPWGHDGMKGKKPAFRGVVELTFDDGSKEYHGTDCIEWSAGIAGPVTHASIFDGEEYDARIPLGFDTPDKLSKPEINTEFNGEILPSNGAEIYFREDLALEPQTIYVWNDITGEKPGEHGSVIITRKYMNDDEIILEKGENLVIDFGQNSSAVPEFIFKAAEGTKLKCLPSEILNDGNGAESRGMDGPMGSVHRRNLRLHESGIQLTYTFGKENELYSTYRPECSFFGYRYLSVSADNTIHIKQVKSIPVTSISKNLETGSITTGNDDINKLISNTIWGMRSNYLSVPTDCPQRDERLGWTADTQVFTETGTFFANTDYFFRKWTRDLRDSQAPDGGMPGVAPTAQYGNEMSRLGWADAAVIVPWVIWKQFGDTDIIQENWNAMDKFITHIGDVKYDHDALKNDNQDYQWADWLSYEPLESCSGRKDYQDSDGNWHVRPETYQYWNYLSANYWLMDASMMRDMALATGRDASKYIAMEKAARKYILDHHIKSNGQFTTEILNTMQTPALFALKNGLVNGKAKEDMISRLRSNFKEHDNCLQTGFLGTSILMSTLTENGMSDIAYNLLFQRKNPSWLYSIDNGATTIWERWNSYMIEHGMGPAGMNSFNHYAYGCVCEWIWKTIAGIAADKTAPGFKTIIMKPIPDKRLGYVTACYDSAAGQIKSSWKYDGDTWIWDFTIPEGATALVTPPGDTTAKKYRSGTYRIIR